MFEIYCEEFLLLSLGGKCSAIATYPLSPPWASSLVAISSQILIIDHKRPLDIPCVCANQTSSSDIFLRQFLSWRMMIRSVSWLISWNSYLTMIVQSLHSNTSRIRMRPRLLPAGRQPEQMRPVLAACEKSKAEQPPPQRVELSSVQQPRS